MIERTQGTTNNSQTAPMLENRFIRFTKLSWRYKKCFTIRGSKYDLSANEIALLMIMYNKPEVDNANRLKDELGITKGMISRYVDDMIRQGYIRAEHDAKDRRIIRLYLCPKAVDICQQVNPMGYEFYEVIAQGIEPEKIAAMLETMEQLSANLDKVDALK